MGRSRPGATGRSYENYIDDKEIEEIAQFANRALRPGSWLFIFVLFANFGKFYEYLSKAMFSVPQYPFSIQKDTGGTGASRGASIKRHCVVFWRDGVFDLRKVTGTTSGWV